MPEFGPDRANALDLCMAESMPFQQHWEYRTTWPIAEILHDQYFLPMRGNLRAGDQINICRYGSREWKDLLEIATVRVIKSGLDEKAVPLAIRGDIAGVGDEPVQQEPIEIVPGKSGKHRLVKGDEVIGEFGSKKEAEDAFNKMVA